MPITIRKAAPADVPALVRLRLANAETHLQLDPADHRLPDPEAVRRYFEDALLARSDVLVLVAVADGEVTGMAEVVIRPDPPSHQILIPRRAAEIHTVVLAGHRGSGTGKALVRAAERAAADHGVQVLQAAIFARNHDAARFYETAGYGPRGTLLHKKLGSPPPR